MGRITTDIRVIKRELRKKYRDIRAAMPQADKEQQDKQLRERLFAFEEYKNAKTLLCFVSTPLEVNTIPILEHAFKAGKTVAVPKCIDLKGGMRFYIIRSFDDLEKSTFSLLEPKLDVCKRLEDFSGSICILPGFAYDNEGYRIGFGKGYYDRFLKNYNGKKLAVCYNSCMTQKLPHGRYDVAADYIITPKYILTIQHYSKVKSN